MIIPHQNSTYFVQIYTHTCTDITPTYFSISLGLYDCSYIEQLQPYILCKMRSHLNSNNLECINSSHFFFRYCALLEHNPLKSKQVLNKLSYIQ